MFQKSIIPNVVNRLLFLFVCVKKLILLPALTSFSPPSPGVSLGLDGTHHAPKQEGPEPQ